MTEFPSIYPVFSSARVDKLKYHLAAVMRITP